MTYEKRAQSILKDAIKSAIYIDDNARGFYEIADNSIPEKELSVNLYTNFKKAGISLEVFKYEKGMESSSENLNFITENRDLVILDWNLEGKSGEYESLMILNRVVNTNHIHFCTLYTVEPNLDDILKNILCFFSGLSKEEFLEAKESCEIIFEGVNLDLFHQVNLNRNHSESGRLIAQILKENKNQVAEFREGQHIDDNKCAIIKASILNLLKNPILSDSRLHCPSFVDSEEYIVVINNTIITILNKSQNNAEELLGNFFHHIVNHVDSFNQLLGVELYNTLFRNSIITNDAVMSFSRDALVFHRKKLKEENLGYFFNSFMDEMLIEKIAVSLRDRKSELLDDVLLDSFEADLDGNTDQREFQKMNVFYNSSFLKKVNKPLNFGDVFKIVNEEKYLICITPLCDCLRPQDKTKGNFYFAEGQNVKLDTALKTGDAAFISYLPNNVIIRWSEVSSEADINKIKLNPLYVKPVQYKILENQNIIDENNELTLHYLNREGIVKSKRIKYLSTIRPNYTQRIANHAFSYPLRVGVDFAKV